MYSRLLVKKSEHIKSYFKNVRISIYTNSGLMVGFRQSMGFVLIIAAIVILVFSYNAYITSYHKTISTSNFTFLFSGIFWDLVGIFISAILIAVGLILVFPKGVSWIANRNRA